MRWSRSIVRPAQIRVWHRGYEPFVGRARVDTDKPILLTSEPTAHRPSGRRSGTDCCTPPPAPRAPSALRAPPARSTTAANWGGWTARARTLTSGSRRGRESLAGGRDGVAVRDGEGAGQYVRTPSVEPATGTAWRPRPGCRASHHSHSGRWPHVGGIPQ